MSFLDEKILKQNLENILSMMDDNPEDSLSVVEEMADTWSFVELDDFYEDALLKNDTGINDLIWTASIGCALIERCDLSRDEYIQWARKSQKDYAYTLLKLIGIEEEEYKSAFEEKQTEEKKIHNDKLISDLKQKKQLISWSNTSTDYTLFGESIVMSDKSGDLGELFSCLDEAHEFASEVLLRELERRCSNCEEALDNIVKVLDNAGDAQWVKCRRYLKQKYIAENEIERIYNLYMETAGSSRKLKEEFDTAYILLLEKLEEFTNDIYQKDANKRDMQLTGGGFGLAGSAVGMLTAGITAKVYSSIVSAGTNGALRRLDNKFEEVSKEYYLGKEAKDTYIEWLRVRKEELKEICLETFFAGVLEEQEDASEIIENFKEEELKLLTADEMRQLVSLLLFIYPFELCVYKFALDHMIGIRSELKRIGDHWKVDLTGYKEGLDQIAQKQINLSDGERFKGYTYEEVFGVLQDERKEAVEQFLEKHGDTLDLGFAIVFRKRFKAMIMASPLKENIVNKYDYCIRDLQLFEAIKDLHPIGQYILYYTLSLIITDFNICIKNKEGMYESIAIKEIQEVLVIRNCSGSSNVRLCVRMKNGDNIFVDIAEENIAELSDLIGMFNSVLVPFTKRESGRYYGEARWHIGMNLAFCEKCNSINQQYVKHGKIFKHYLCGKCGAEEHYLNRIILGESENISEDELQRRISELDVNGEYDSENRDASLYSIEEILPQEENSTDETKEVAKQYISTKEGEIDYKTAALYRTLFKMVLMNYGEKERCLNAYDYTLSHDSVLSRILKKTEQTGEYVLFSSVGVVITDFRLYISSEGSVYSFEWEKIIEVLPVEGTYSDGYKGIILREKDGLNCKKYDYRLKELTETFALVNIVLELVEQIKGSAVEERYYDKERNEQNERIIFCKSCGKWSSISVSELKLINLINCSKCNAGMTNFLNVVKCKSIEKVKSDVQLWDKEQIDRFVDEEIKNDAENSGILEFGISLQKEVELKRKALAEEADKAEEIIEENEIFDGDANKEEANSSPDSLQKEKPNGENQWHFSSKEKEIVLQEKVIKEGIKNNENGELVLFADAIGFYSEETSKEQIIPLKNIKEIRADKTLRLWFKGKFLLEVFVGLENASQWKEELELRMPKKIVPVEKAPVSEECFCRFCGKKIIRTSKFCNFCGKENRYGRKSD